jgi:hypothetical protein
MIIQEWFERKARVRERRLTSIFMTWNFMSGDNNPLDVLLNQTLVLEAVEGYLKDVERLIHADLISDRVQHHKIAGLMAANLLTFKPIVTLDNTEPLQRPFFDNEVFAIRHALMICFQESPADLERFVASDGYQDWFKNTVRFCKRCPVDGRTLIVAFDALAAIHIRRDLRWGGD